MLRRLDGEGFPAVAPNAPELPYAPKPPAWRAAAAGLSLGAAGLAILVGAIFDPRLRFERPIPFDLVCAVVWTVGAFLVWRLRQPVAIFRLDRFETRRLGGWRGILRSDITGVGETRQTRKPARFPVYLKPGAGKPAMVDGWLRRDPVILRWFAGAPDLDARAVEVDHRAA